MRRRHELKTWRTPFQATWSGFKLYEVRKNDRDFAPGDQLVLREYEPTTETYSGRVIVATVSYMVRGPEFGVAEGYVVMGLLWPEMHPSFYPASRKD